jgi:hypothetical protein
MMRKVIQSCRRLALKIVLLRNKEDILFVSVWDKEDLKTEVTIRPDGKISFPLAGDIPAVG